MASLKIALLLFVCLEGCVPTSALNIDGLQNVPNAMTPNGDVCKDCTQIFELLADLFSNQDLQKKIMDGIETVCAHLPEPAGKLCKDEVEKMLPIAIKFLTVIVKPAEVCKVIGLCNSCGKQEEMLRYFVKEALEAAATSENQAQPTSQCSFCIFLVKTLEDLLPRERTEGAVIKLVEEICHILPSSYRDQCEAVVGRFTKTVLDAILSYATPQSICTLIHLCHGQEAPVVDPCTLSTYRCRDIKTAVKCGTMFYCQKFAWKPLSYNKF
ncbi:surfactant protein Ba isoform X1 [Larimichthys crocea]|uniref:surfactant protein Ba isoform X1 n=1 Tax=Larimichthys crocea TaxID=215358 RepID=UPI000F5E3182|nr:prosaposin isoform X1 [Larimichthys crocea]